MIENREKLSPKRTLTGKVVSDRMSKTITVSIERHVKHHLYGKIVVRTNKYHVHDENNQAKVGDTVEIREGRPISKTKSWNLARLVKVAQVL